MKVLMTVDKVDGFERLPSFVLFDLNTNKYEFVPYEPQLDSQAAINSGRTTFRPFGIHKDADIIYIASNDRLGKFSAGAYRFLGLVPKTTLFVNTHQIAGHNKLIYTANAANDSVGVFDGEVTTFFSFQTLKKSNSVCHPLDAYQFDKKHINSLLVYEDFLYVMAHRDTQHGSAAYCVDPTTWKVQQRIPAGVDCHGIQIHGSSLYTLSTGTGDLWEVSLSGDNITRYFVVDPNLFFLRGLQKFGTKLYLVASTNFHSTEGSNGCYLYVFDLVKKQIETKIDLAPIVVVNDIFIGE